MLILAIVLLLLLLAASFIIFSKDIFAPPVIVIMGFILATVCALINQPKWEIQYTGKFVVVVAVGVLAFTVGCVLAVVLCNIKKKNKLELTVTPSVAEVIDIPLWKTILVVIFQILACVWLYIELKSKTGGHSWNEIITIFRESQTTVSPNAITIRISTLCELASTLCFSIALIYAYVVGNNIAIGAFRPIKKLAINFAPIILTMVNSFMHGERTNMIRVWVALIVVLVTIRNRKYGWKASKETYKTLAKIAASALLIAVLFALLRSTVGRRETDWNPVYYVTFYAGTSIAALNLYLGKPLPSSAVWGQETFHNINVNIGTWLNKPELITKFYKEFRYSPNGTLIGNVYTALRPPLRDFGFAGMIIVMILMGLFFTFLYCRTRYKVGKSKIDLLLLTYSYIAYTYYMYFYNMYNSFLSLGFVKIFIGMILIRWFVLDGDFKKLFTEKIFFWRYLKKNKE